jgi:prolyl-tRNA synthetase
VIVPIYRSDEEREKVEAAAEQIKLKLEYLDLSVKFDNRDTYKPGYKFAEWELKGVPVRIAIGPRDIENGTVELARRDTKEKSVTSIDGIDLHIKNLLNEIQSAIYERAKLFRDQSIHTVNSWDEFKEVLETKGGFISAHWDGTGETEEKIKELTKATIRCMPLDNIEEEGTCVLTGNPSKQRVLFAKAY